MAKPTISNGRQWAFENHWKLGGVIDSREISWRELKFSCSFIHITHTNVFYLSQSKIHIPPTTLKHTHIQTYIHTLYMGPGGAVSATSCSLLSWVQLVTWAACLNNSVIPKASSLQRTHGTVPKTRFFIGSWYSLTVWLILKFSFSKSLSLSWGCLSWVKSKN